MTADTPYQVLTDVDFDARVPMETAVETIRETLVSHGRGHLDAPSRVHLDADDGALVFTVGLDHESDVMGFRVYVTLPGSPDDHQLVATWDAATGAFEGVIVGHPVGTVRTGAIGGVAVDTLARHDATTLGLLGSGRQAATQLAAAAVVRDLDHVRVYSPTESHREAFAVTQGDELDLDVEAVSDAEAAVRPTSSSPRRRAATRSSIRTGSSTASTSRLSAQRSPTRTSSIPLSPPTAT